MPRARVSLEDEADQEWEDHERREAEKASRVPPPVRINGQPHELDELPPLEAA